MIFNFLVRNINESIAKDLDYRGRVVDLGCGNSPYKQYILEVASEYVGVDWQLSRHDRANVDVLADLTETLPFCDASADTVVAFQVMEHLPEPGLFLSECFRILTPGGRLFLTVPFMWRIHEAPYDYFRFTRYGLLYLLNRQGFEDILIDETTGFWQMFCLKLNYHTKRFARGPLVMLFAPMWWLGQKLAPIMDRVDRGPEETISYVVKATRPEVKRT